MEDIGPSGRVTSTTGDVGPDGDIVGALIERFRVEIGPDRSVEIDVDEQAALAAQLVVSAPLWTVLQ